MPPVPQPMTRISVVTVFAISFSAISGALPSQSPESSSFAVSFVITSTGISPFAWAIHFEAAFWTAFEVIDAPDTESTFAVWPASSAFFSSTADFCPIPGVSFDASITTSVILFASNVIVTITSPPIPAALAE